MEEGEQGVALRVALEHAVAVPAYQVADPVDGGVKTPLYGLMHQPFGQEFALDLEVVPPVLSDVVVPFRKGSLLLRGCGKVFPRYADGRNMVQGDA